MGRHAMKDWTELKGARLPRCPRSPGTGRMRGTSSLAKLGLFGGPLFSFSPTKF
jgi:hypothetical protein